MSEFSDSWDKALQTKFNAQKLTPDNAAALLDTVEVLAEKAGLPPLNAYLTESIPGLGSYGRINAGGLLGDTILLTKGLLESLGVSDMHAGQIDTRLQAVLAHEMSHNKHWMKEVSSKTLPLLLMPAAAMCSLGMYRNVRHLHDTSAMHTALQDEKSNALTAIENEQGAPPTSWQKRLVAAAEYIAAGALGLGAGVLITRRSSLIAEYRADAFSKQLMGSPEPLIQGLQKVHDDTLALIKREGEGDISPFEKTLVRVFCAHPSLEQRITALQR